MSIVAENLAKIKAEIGNTKLIAVSKVQPIEKLHDALQSGHRVFGENRVQEAQSKFPQLREEYKDIELHLIGPLQTNKVKEALALFDVIQTIDREKLALAIAKEHGKLNMEHKENPSMLHAPCSNFMIQVNIGEEEQKAGIPPQEAEEFAKFCMNDLGLNITGLMCIPPVDEPAGMYFALLKNISLNLKPKTLNLSMGMSGDYLEAIEMGATHVRVGSAIFGERTK